MLKHIILIPFSKRNDFEVNIDVLENIVCLTPKNHKKSHTLAYKEEQDTVLETLFEKKKDGLRSMVSISL